MTDPQTEHVPSVLEDPGMKSISLVYVKAYLDAAGSDAQAAVDELVSFVVEVVQPQKELQQVLFNPAIGHDEKVALLQRLLDGRASERLINFVRVLSEHDRLELLPHLADVARHEFNERSGRKQVYVTSAQPLTDELKAEVESRLVEQLGHQPILELDVDPSLLGGLVVRVEDKVYDGSLRTRIQQLRARLRERSLNEIQRGRDRFSHSA